MLKKYHMRGPFLNIKVGGVLLLESMYFSCVHTKTYNFEASYMHSRLPLCSVADVRQCIMYVIDNAKS